MAWDQTVLGHFTLSLTYTENCILNKFINHKIVLLAFIVYCIFGSVLCLPYYLFQYLNNRLLG
jgi:hypothetical protein